MEKSAVFIDGGYLNKILKHYFKESDIDYLKFSELICKEVGVSRLRTYYYHSLPVVRPNSKEDERRHSNMWKFISNLKRLSRFEVKLGRLQLIGGQFKQKMIDVLMSLDITSMCFDKQIAQVILIAGDADFVPAIKKAKDYGAIVHLFYHPSSVHNELLDEVDELHIISKELIENCKKLELR
ncbi:MAG: NYN domain-containing protein [Nanoarchaeota archaeon]